MDVRPCTFFNDCILDRRKADPTLIFLLTAPSSQSRASGDPQAACIEISRPDRPRQDLSYGWRCCDDMVPKGKAGTSLNTYIETNSDFC